MEKMKVVPVSVRGRKEVEVGREVVDQEKVEGVDSRVQKLTRKSRNLQCEI